MAISGGNITVSKVSNNIYVEMGTNPIHVDIAALALTTATSITAAAALTDHAIVRGDGGASGIQTSLATINDAGSINIPTGQQFTINGVQHTHTGVYDPSGTAQGLVTSHTHAGSTNGPQLAQANTHETPDTDSATTSLHHTLGTGANQSAAGNHGHTASAVGAVALSLATAAGDTIRASGAGAFATLSPATDYGTTGGALALALVRDSVGPLTLNANVTSWAGCTGLANGEGCIVGPITTGGFTVATTGLSESFDGSLDDIAVTGNYLVIWRNAAGTLMGSCKAP